MKRCISIRQSSPEESLKILKNLKNMVDLVELWLDGISDLDLSELVRQSSLSLLGVYKRPEAGGQFVGSFEEEAEGLFRAIDSDLDYVDIPLEMPKNLNKKIVQYAQEKSCKTLVSFHDYQQTFSPKKLDTLVKKMLEREGGILKIAMQANTNDDVLNLMQLALKLKSENMPHIVIAMGELGRITRVLSNELGNEIDYRALTEAEVKWGQLTI